MERCGFEKAKLLEAVQDAIDTEEENQVMRVELDKKPTRMLGDLYKSKGLLQYFTKQIDDCK